MYTTYYRPYEAYLRPIRRTLYLSQSYFYRWIFPTLYPGYKASDRAARALLGSTSSGDAPSLATLAVLALTALVAFKMLDMLRRSIVYWMGVALRLALWLSMAALGVYVWQRGVARSVEDFGFVLGLLAGWGDEGERIGKGRAARWENDARRVSRQGPPRGRKRGARWG